MALYIFLCTPGETSPLCIGTVISKPVMLER